MKTQHKDSFEEPELTGQEIEEDNVDLFAPPDGWSDEVMVNHGESRLLSEQDSLRVIAVDGQVYDGNTQNYLYWRKNGYFFTNENPAHDIITGSATFEAVFEGVVIVPDLSVNISGPSSLNPNEYGTFIADPSGGNTPYINYRWWERKDDGIPPLKGDNIILAPPSGYWIEQTGWEGQQTVQFSRTYDFSLKCEVTDSDNNTATDIHSVIVGGGLAKTQGTMDETSGIAIPEGVELTGNFPNPFNPNTTIRFGLPDADKVLLQVFNVNGQLIATLVDGYLEPGYHDINFNGQHLSSGIYLYKLSTADFTAVKRMLIVK